MDETQKFFLEILKQKDEEILKMAKAEGALRAENLVVKHEIETLRAEARQKANEDTANLNFLQAELEKTRFAFARNEELKARLEALYANVNVLAANVQRNANEGDFLSVSKHALYFIFWKSEFKTDFVLTNIVQHRIAFDIDIDSDLYGIAPHCGILEVGEQRTITVQCKRKSKFYVFSVHSTKVPEGGGQEVQANWFSDDPSGVKTKLLPAYESLKCVVV